MDETTGEVDCAQLERDLHDPRQLLPGLRHLPGETDRLDRRTDPGRLHGPRRRQPRRRCSTSCRSPTTRPTTPSAASRSTSATSTAPAAQHAGHRHRAAPPRSPSTAPSARPAATQNWFLGPDFELLYWMEKQGYDVSYTDDVADPQQPRPAARTTTSIVVSGHSEYWSLAAVQRLQGGARRRRQHRLLQRQHRLLEGPLRERRPHPRLLQDRPGQRRGRQRLGQPERLGPRRDQRHRRRRPRARRRSPAPPTTTRRTRPPPSATTAPRTATPTLLPAAASAPTCPRTSSWGVMYVGDNDALQLPAHGPGRQRQRRIRRRPDLAQHRHLRRTARPRSAAASSAGSGTRSRPRPSTSTHQPERGRTALRDQRRRRVNDNSWLQDEGRLRNTAPPPGQPGTVGAVTYKAPAGAEVFASGTMYWAARPRPANADDRIQQATYNIFSDMGVQPNTPEEDITLDPGGSNHAPNASFTISPNPAKTGDHGHLRRLGLERPRRLDRQIRMGPRRQRHLRDEQRRPAERRPTATPPRAHTPCACGSPTTAAPPTLRGAHADDHQQPAADRELHRRPRPRRSRTKRSAFNGSGSNDPDGTIAKYEWDFDGNGTYETNSRHQPDRSPTPTPPPAPTRSACG